MLSLPLEMFSFSSLVLLGSLEGGSATETRVFPPLNLAKAPSPLPSRKVKFGLVVAVSAAVHSMVQVLYSMMAFVFSDWTVP